MSYDPVILFHLILIGLIGGCLVACGIAAIVELYTGTSEYQYRKRMKQRAKRRAIRRSFRNI